MGLSKRAKRTLIILGVLVVASPVGVLVADKVTPSNARQALPATASDVREYYSDNAWQGDFVRCLQAKMPQPEMPQFAANLGLTQRYNSSVHSKLPLSFAMADAPSWWHPPDRLDGAYFKYTPGKESFSLAVYQNGRVYFLATAW